MITKPCLVCCAVLFFAVIQVPSASLETEARSHQNKRLFRLRNTLKRQRRSARYASIRFINKTGKDVQIVYMDNYRNPYPYTTLRPNERKAISSRVYTTWYAYDGSSSRYLLLNSKPNFLVLRRHLRRITNIIVSPKDGKVPPIPSQVLREKYIEVMVIADSTMYKKYGKNTEKYVLTLVNQGRRHFMDKSFGIKLSVIVTRVEIIKRKQNDFKINKNAANQNMRNACDYAARFNSPYDYDNRHFDFAVIFTARNFGYSGYTPLYSMCQASLACTLIRDSGLASAHVVPHEIAHSLGIDHDGLYNNCTTDGWKGSMMGKVLYARLDKYYWSRCSRDQLMVTIGYFACLNDKPRVEINRYMKDLPGVVMNRSEQCAIAFAKHYTACTKPTHPDYDCKAKYCAPNWNTLLCSYHSRPPLDGTKCNKGKGWCIKGTCYPYGRFNFHPIHGGWSEWQAWGKCSASCGIGISYRKRRCDNPRPKNEGKKCPGSAIEKMVCKIKDCPIVEAVEDIRSKFCKSLKNENWIWFTEREAFDIVSATDGLNCTFENNCSWSETLKDEFNWTRISGRTPSAGTGPSQDHTYENKTGHYLFIEASTGDGDDLRKEGFRARLMSPLLRAPEVCLRFYYHMLGSHLGSLRVYKRDDEKETLLWKQKEDMGDRWLKGEVEIVNSKAFEILIEAVRGRHYQGDIAIDDITVTPGKCSLLDTTALNPCLITCGTKDGMKFLPNVTLPNTYSCHNDGRLDICISGKCEKLGCDLKLGSNKTTNKCRICDGDNSTCNLTTKQMVVKLNVVGETELMAIPANSTNIKVEIGTASYRRVGIKAIGTGTYFPGNVNEDTPSPKYLALLGQTYRLSFKNEIVTIESQGPSAGRIIILMKKSQESTVKLKYRMFTPTSKSG